MVSRHTEKRLVAAAPDSDHVCSDCWSEPLDVSWFKGVGPIAVDNGVPPCSCVSSFMPPSESSGERAPARGPGQRAHDPFSVERDRCVCPAEYARRVRRPGHGLHREDHLQRVESEFRHTGAPPQLWPHRYGCGSTARGTLGGPDWAKARHTGRSGAGGCGHATVRDESELAATGIAAHCHGHRHRCCSCVQQRHHAASSPPAAGAAWPSA